MLRSWTIFFLIVFLFSLPTGAFAGFDHGDDDIVPVFPPPPGTAPSPDYIRLSKACDDLAKYNKEAADGIREMLNEGQINIGFGPNTSSGGAWCVADGEAGVEGDSINVNPDYVTGGQYTDAEGDQHDRHNHEDPSSCSGTSWNHLLGALAHEWVHANSALPRPTDQDTSAGTDYRWEKPAYEKEMEVLEAAGEPDGFYVLPGLPIVVKTRIQFLKQELEKKKRAAMDEMSGPWPPGAGYAGEAGASRILTCSILDTAGEPSTITWGVDGNTLYGMVPTRDCGDAWELGIDTELDFLGMSGLPLGTENAVLFVAGQLGSTGVILGIEVSGTEILSEVLHVEIPDCEPRSIAYRDADGSLWVLDGVGQSLQAIVDTDSDWVPDTLAPAPYATAGDWPVLAEAQEVVVYSTQAGVGVSPTGFAPFDMVPIAGPLTFLTDGDADGVADGAVEMRYGDFTQFAPRILGSPNAGATSCDIFGVAGAAVTLETCTPEGIFTGEVLGSATVGDDFLANMGLSRPLAEGEYVRLYDPVNDIHDEAAPYLVPPAGTNRAPIPVYTGWQRVYQTTPAGAAVTLDASESYDPDGDSLTFEWEEVIDSYSGCPTLGTGPTITVDMSPDIHTVRLIVSDGTESVSTYTWAGVVPNEMPVADPNGPYTAECGDSIQLDGSGSVDPNEPADSIQTWEWDLDDDGSFEFSDPIPTRTLPWEDITALVCAGAPALETPYPITLRVTDTHGATATAATTLTITPVGNTHLGTNVTVELDFGVTVTFAEVTTCGDTTVTTSTTPPGDPPAGFLFLDTYYDINTTAGYTGFVWIHIPYDEADLPAGTDEWWLTMWRWDGVINDFYDITSDRDPVNNVITGSWNILSWFAIGVPSVPSYQFQGFLPPVEGRTKPFKRGSTIPLKFRISDAAGNPVPDAVATLTIYYLESGAPSGEAEVVSTAAGDWGNQFRYDPEGDLYIFNLSTKDPSFVGYYTYRAEVTLDDGSTHSVEFALK